MDSLSIEIVVSCGMLVLIGYLAYYAGFTRALFEAAKRWVGCNLFLATSSLQIASCFGFSDDVRGVVFAFALL